MQPSQVSLQQVDLALVIDQCLTALTVLATLAAGVVLIYLLLTNSRKRTTNAVAMQITDALAQQQFKVTRSKLTDLEYERAQVAREVARLKIEYETEENDAAREEISTKLQSVKQQAERIEERLQEKQDTLMTEAREYAKNYVADILPSSLDISTPTQEKFFLEFMTVIVIIIGVIELALLKILNGEQLTPIFASIAGYVLGHSTSQRK